MQSKLIKVLGIILGFVILSVASISLFGYTKNDKERSGTPVFPEELQGLPLKQAVSGPPAVSMISKLHGTDITIKEGHILTYSNDNAQVMIWISESNNAKDALNLFEVMDRKIIQANKPGKQEKGPPFTDRRSFKEGNIEIIAVKGMGMENYYYYIGTKVYWIAVGGVNPEDVLRESIKTLP